MRDAFVASLTELAAKDSAVILLTADLGFGIFDDFSRRFPDQFLNVGVAEQNMTGVATGLALEGYKVFTYSIANFATLRCLEQIRNDAAYHGANITIVASGGGFTYGSLGMSHHATEDVAILRALPGVTVVVPADAWESAEATRALANRPGVGYLRIEKSGPDTARKPGEVFEIGRARRLKDGQDVTLFFMGGVFAEVLAACERIERETPARCRIVSVHSVKPLDEAEIVAAARETGGIVVVEEHTRTGGLGSAVAECLAKHETSPGFFRGLGIDDTYVSVVGDQNYLRRASGIDSESIYTAVVQALKKRTL